MLQIPQNIHSQTKINTKNQQEDGDVLFELPQDEDLEDQSTALKIDEEQMGQPSYYSMQSDNPNKDS